MTITKRSRKPILIKCGNHYINPNDISRITRVDKGTKPLYVIRFFSDPNPDFACWVKGSDIDLLLERFNVIVSDDKEE